MLANIFRRSMASISRPALPKYAVGTQPFTVLVEGNIGSGKTTFLNYFEKYPDVCLLAEPVQAWRNVEGGNLLELMYKSPERWAMPFQSYVTLTMLRSHIMQTDKRIKLMERSYFSARNCFVEVMFKNNKMDEVMYRILQEWYDFHEKTLHIQVDLIVYLRTTPEVVYERMRKRARSEESCVSLEYLKELHELHEKWLMHNRAGSDVQVFILDADKDLDSILTEYKRSEECIINPILKQQQPFAITVSPSKRKFLSN